MNKKGKEVEKMLKSKVGFSIDADSFKSGASEKNE